RIIAATNRDLREAVDKGTFREDLFYRLQVFDIAIPPLRDRRADILPLSESMLDEIGQAFGRPAPSRTHGAREALMQYEWPGNVRELRNALERAAIRCDGTVIDETHLALRRAEPPAPAGSDLRSLERDTIRRALEACAWNKVKAAKRLGLTRTQLYGRMHKHAIESAPAQPERAGV